MCDKEIVPADKVAAQIEKDHGVHICGECDGRIRSGVALTENPEEDCFYEYDAA